MIVIKTPAEIEIMRKGGRILSETMKILLSAANEGVTELELDDLAEKTIRDLGGEPGFKKVEGYFNTICTAVNDVSVHGIPSRYKLKSGDVLGIDCGVYYDGFHTDMSETKVIGGAKDSKINEFIKVGKEALKAGIEQAKVGNHIGNISKAIQDIVETKNGYSVVRTLVGHGVGKDLHEDPEVPGYLYGDIQETPLLKEGMTIAIEVIYNMGKSELKIDKDGWSLRTKDGSIAGLFERSIALTPKGSLILTPLL